ncbi:uncharacterized protein LOC134856767 [Symsagittifera roscoffensis]|uniref:uncharacterized protein LOC134856767 n=1 Tax=Symsagittifera roscoffensis TaxID=84072 RepID=UPI00307B5084
MFPHYLPMFVLLSLSLVAFASTSNISASSTTPEVAAQNETDLLDSAQEHLESLWDELEEPRQEIKDLWGELDIHIQFPSKADLILFYACVGVLSIAMCACCVFVTCRKSDK